MKKKRRKRRIRAAPPWSPKGSWRRKSRLHWREMPCPFCRCHVAPQPLLSTSDGERSTATCQVGPSHLRRTIRSPPSRLYSIGMADWAERSFSKASKSLYAYALSGKDIHFQVFRSKLECLQNRILCHPNSFFPLIFPFPLEYLLPFYLYSWIFTPKSFRYHSKVKQMVSDILEFCQSRWFQLRVVFLFPLKFEYLMSFQFR